MLVFEAGSKDLVHLEKDFNFFFWCDWNTSIFFNIFVYVLGDCFNRTAEIGNYMYFLSVYSYNQEFTIPLLQNMDLLVWVEEE